MFIVNLKILLLLFVSYCNLGQWLTLAITITTSQANMLEHFYGMTASDLEDIFAT